MAAAGDRTGDDSYYGRPIVKGPVWKPYIGVYFFTGGLAGASSLLGLAARAAGNDRLARNASLIAAAGVFASPPLLILDLGRPKRFLNMMRVFKITSPMSVGTWVLAASGATDTVAAACSLARVAPRLRLAAECTSAVLAPALCTYTAVLLSDTAIPVWHEARGELPFVFVGSAAASAGAVATLVTPPADAGAARRLVGLGAVTELAALVVMERRLGELARPYREGAAGRYSKAAKALTATGALLTVSAGRRPRQARLGAGLVTAAALCSRLAVLAAGSQSAADPSFTVEPQRRRAEAAVAGAEGRGRAGAPGIGA